MRKQFRSENEEGKEKRIQRLKYSRSRFQISSCSLRLKVEKRGSLEEITPTAFDADGVGNSSVPAVLPQKEIEASKKTSFKQL
jgi:hypothetical protein